jgi:Rrf2 family protein
MDITRRTDYAIRMMIELSREDRGPVSVRALAGVQEVPYAFARAVARDLADSGLVVTHRGAAGGLTLARPAAKITLLDIITATQGSVSVAVCANDPSWCKRSGGCSVHRVWCGADEMLRRYFETKTLAGLVKEEGR